jgi:hypothetical protein
VGKVDLVLLDPATRRVTGIVVRRGAFMGRDVIVPAEWIGEIERDRIVLDADRRHVEQLPEYRPDEELWIDVLDAIWYESGVPTHDLHHLEVSVTDGVVVLNGRTQTEAERAAIEAAARRVRGVLDVRNNIDTFEALEAAVRGTRAGADARG